MQQYEPHPITRDLAGITTLFPLARSITPAKTPPAGHDRAAAGAHDRRTPGARPTAQALEQGQAKPDPQDPKGPLTLAAVATKDKARIVVYGTAEPRDRTSS